MKREVWKEELRDNTDQVFAWQIVQGIAEGFQIGYNAKIRTLHCRESNMISAAEQPDVVRKYPAEEWKASRITPFG